MATTINKGLTLRPTVSPRLPAATSDYDPSMLDSENNILRQYFSQLDNFTQTLLSNTGGRFLSMPYGAFSDYNNQTTTANTATLMGITNTDFSNGVSISSSKISVTYPGIYNLQFSTQFDNSATSTEDISIWLRQNGTDISGSTGFVYIAGSHGGINGHIITGWNYYVSMAASDYIQIYWSTTNANVTIATYAASTGPVRPSTASVVATLSFVSTLPVV
jgi:hypothetical protein